MPGRQIPAGPFRARKRSRSSSRASFRPREAAPFYTPVMPRSGRPFSVRMTNLGPFGWVSDRAGYRYQANHPETGRPWPAIPRSVCSRCGARSPTIRMPPQACLVNLYREGAKMGLHRMRTKRILQRRWFRSRSAIPPFSGSAALERGGETADAQALVRRCRW